MRKIAKMTSKGQITVPSEMRRALGVSAGDSLVFEKKGNTVILAPLRHASVFEEFRGIGTPGIGSGKKAVLRWIRDIRGDL